MRFQKLELEDPIKHDIVGPDKLTQAGFCLEEITIYAAPNLLKQEWMKTPLKIACMHPSKTIMYLDIEAYRKLDDEKRLYVLALAKGEQLTRPITDLYRVYLQLYRQFTQLRKLERSAVLKYSSTLRSLRCTHYILPFRYASNLLGNTSFAIRDIKERIKFFKTHAPVRQETDALELILYYALLSLTGNAK